MKMRKAGWIAGLFLAYGLAGAEVIYSNDFNGVVGTVASETEPEINTIAGYIDAATKALVADGEGRLYSIDQAGNNVNYRFRLNPVPLNKNPQLAAVKCTVTMRAPSTKEWVGIGFHESNANGLLDTKINSGPWLQVGKSYITVRGGYSTQGSMTQFKATHQSSEMIRIEFTCRFNNTFDLKVNGDLLADGLPLEHINLDESGSASPVFGWLQMQFRQQNTIENGGAYIDSLVVETHPKQMG